MSNHICSLANLRILLSEFCLLPQEYQKVGHISITLLECVVFMLTDFFFKKQVTYDSLYILTKTRNAGTRVFTLFKKRIKIQNLETKSFKNTSFVFL